MPLLPPSAPESRANYTTSSDTASVSSSCNSSRRSGCSTSGELGVARSVWWRRSAARGRPLPRCAGYSDCLTKTTLLRSRRSLDSRSSSGWSRTRKQLASPSNSRSVANGSNCRPASSWRPTASSQEALTNVIKHAQPAAAHVRLSYEPERACRRDRRRRSALQHHLTEVGELRACGSASPSTRVS